MRKAPSKARSEQLEGELRDLAALPEPEIDTREMPEIEDWSGARRGALSRPVKQQITLRLDSDVIAWFRSRSRQGGDQQSAINRALREYMVRHRREPA